MGPVTCPAQDISTADCADCHTDGDDDIAVVTEDLLARSVHEGFDCIDCHDGIEDLPHDDLLPAVQCGECHEDAAEQYVLHGRSVVGEDDDIPGCADCHGTHEILAPSDRESLAHRQNLPQTCGTCHSNGDLAEKHGIRLSEPVAMYEKSVHGRAAGIVDFSATCSDCHATDGSSHQIYGPGNPESTINHFRVPNTCGQCHKIIEQEYWEGIHGQLAARGETATPVCTSCHGEHGILATDDPESRVSPTQVAESTCAPCHDSAVLREKYGRPTERLKSFVDAYHGRKSGAGDTKVANCSSCHGSHLILPRMDERSSVNPANLQQTCAGCHPGISPAMASMRIHVPESDTRTGWAQFFATVYVLLIVAVIGTMLFYTVTDFLRNMRSAHSVPQRRRMNKNELFQHTMLASSFMLLVLSGFALRYSDLGLFDFLFGWDGGFKVRGVVHRISGVVLAFASLWHLAYLLTARGRQFMRDMAPGLQDLYQFRDMLLFNLGRSKSRPRFGRFSYVEKGEYWALIWGTVIMFVSGLMLWFDNFVVQYVSSEVLEVVLVIHFYEAVLATLAVAIWHSYATIFNPEIYPGNPSWIHGNMPVAMYEHEHPADTERVPHPPDDSASS